jgi:hypothetical protein
MWPFRKKPKPKPKRKGLVFDGHRFGVETIEDDDIQGAQYRWNGVWTHTFARERGDLKPFRIREYIGDAPVLPDKLYRGLRWKSCVQPLFRIEASWLDKVNMWLGIALIGILLLALFLLFSSITGTGG